MSTNNIVLVDNETSLNILNTFLSSLCEDKNVSVDTEFTRTKTYYPILDLVQICIDDTVYIVDPHALKLSSFSKPLLILRQIVCSFRLVKILRYCLLKLIS